MSEFELIKQYFSSCFFDKESTSLKNDDCSTFSIPNNMHVATSTDILIEGCHFFSNVEPTSLGHKALGVNLSDLAAVGAKPFGCLLGLGLPDTIDEKWLESFSEGFNTLCKRYLCSLLGGDICSSPRGLFISVTVFGIIDPKKMLRRDSARIGDEIWVSGTMGAADIAYRILSGRIPMNSKLLRQTRKSLEWPEARLELGQFLVNSANSAIDISDGLLQDLGHILSASNVGAYIQYDSIPVSPYLSELSDKIVSESILNGGDVYELCFTASPKNHEWIVKKSKELNVTVNVIGHITDKKHLEIVNSNGSSLNYSPNGFDHFSSTKMRS